jgi:ABC-2 type transport system ATP-binding protein
MTPFPDSGSAAVSVRGLRKAFGDHLVLDEVDLVGSPGSILAVLGPNGAGKTTAIRVLSTLLPPDAGEVRIAGHDVIREPDAVRRVIGVTGQFSAVDGLLTGRENLALISDLLHLDRAEGRRRTAELVDALELGEVADRLAATYSGGLRRRLDLAMTLLSRPQVIFLDEPTTGLDPRGRRAVWQLVRDRVAAGVTVLLTTQYLEEADQLADRVVVLDAGRVVAEGTPAELKRQVPGGRLRLRFASPADVTTAAGALPGADADMAELALEVAAEADSVRDLRAVLDRLDAVGLQPEGLSLLTPDLDDVFLALTGHGAQPAATADVKGERR